MPDDLDARLRELARLAGFLEIDANRATLDQPDTITSLCDSIKRLGITANAVIEALPQDMQPRNDNPATTVEDDDIPF